VKRLQSSKAKDPSESGSLLVVNLRGLVNTRTPVRKTLEQLHLAKRFNATIVPNNESYRGMLHLAKEHVAWCRANAATAEKLLRQRSEKSDGHKFDEGELSKSGFSNFLDLAKAIEAGKASLDGSQGIRQFFRLNSPKGGLKRSIRRQYREGGLLGENELLPDLVERMI
jgi:large subunit ribosomal protein L30